jgi:hypothetical protein
LELPLSVSKMVRSCERGADLLVDIMVDGISATGLKYDIGQKMLIPQGA